MMRTSVMDIFSIFYKGEYPATKVVVPSSSICVVTLSLFKAILFLFTVYNSCFLFSNNIYSLYIPLLPKKQASQ